jgi:nucleoid DNA-binding protein
MKKEHIARRLAKESHISTAAAADQLDRIMSDILKRIRKGETASIPGLGTFRAGLVRDFKFEGAPSRGLDRRASKKTAP